MKHPSQHMHYSQASLWNLLREGRIPVTLQDTVHKVQQFDISGKITMSFLETLEQPSYTTTTYNHPHLMQHVIHYSSSLGFILHDLNLEFASRFTNELLLNDRNAKTLGSPTLTTRASLGVHIKEGNTHFAKYSLLGHVYLLIQIILDEASKTLSTYDEGIQNNLFENKMSERGIYQQLNLFPKEISALKLASAAREALLKFKHDYKICSFYNLIEWRTSTDALESHQPTYPNPCDYTVIINDEKAYCPRPLLSMQENSEHLSSHLCAILQLQMMTLTTML